MQLFFRMLMLCFILLSQSLTAANGHCPANVPQDVFERLTPYFLPDDHKMKKKLDAIFSSPDILENESSLRKAGFKPTGAKGYSKASIVKHKKLKKHLLKIFTDDQVSVVDYEIWMRRIDGAQLTLTKLYLT